MNNFPILELTYDDGFHGFANTRLWHAAKRQGELLANNDRDEWRIWVGDAAHEAGHAIVAFELGWKPEYIRITHSGDIVGRSRYQSIATVERLNRPFNAKHRAYWKCALAVKAGGIAAQKFLVPGPLNRKMTESDYPEAVEICRRLIGSSGKTASRLSAQKRLIVQATARAEEIVSRNREEVLELAREALEKGEIRGKRIERILKAHGVVPQMPEWERCDRTHKMARRVKD